MNENFFKGKENVQDSNFILEEKMNLNKIDLIPFGKAMMNLLSTNCLQFIKSLNSKGKISFHK